MTMKAEREKVEIIAGLRSMIGRRHQVFPMNLDQAPANQEWAA